MSFVSYVDVSRKESCTPKCKPEIPKKNYRLINGCVKKLIKNDKCMDGIHSEIAQYWMRKTQKLNNNSPNDGYVFCHSLVNRDTKDLSKPECITKECISYLNQVDSCLTYLLELKEELDKEFINDITARKNLTNVFRDIRPLKSAYEIIFETVNRLKTNVPGFYLYEIVLDPVVSNVLKVYKSFLNQYAANTKWIGEFYRDNNSCLEACNRVKERDPTCDNKALESCMYTIFNSLFSIEMMFDRYRRCYEETSQQFNMADKARNIISNLLSEMNSNQDQESFLKTQRELNILSGRRRESKINARFLCKAAVMKYSRKYHKLLPRQLVLFSDCLYVTSLPGTISTTTRVRQELCFESMKLSDINEDFIQENSDLKWGICVHSKEGIQEFYFENEETMDKWRVMLVKMVRTESSVQTTLNTDTISCITSLGIEAPRWQKDSSAGYCNGHRCSLKFTATIRRHHCRADGLLYCGSCCNFRVKLEFERQAESTVCELCYNILSKYLNDPDRLEDAKIELGTVITRKSRSGVKIGWLSARLYSKDKSMFLPEMKYFCELDSREAFLKLFEKFEDKIYSEGIMLKGAKIVESGTVSAQYQALTSKQFVIEDENDIPLYHFEAGSEEDCQRWIECIKERL